MGAKTQGGMNARALCVATAGRLVAWQGSRYGGFGGVVGGTLGTALGIWGCDSAGKLMVPYIEPGLPNKSPRVDHMGNTISPQSLVRIRSGRAAALPHNHMTKSRDRYVLLTNGHNHDTGISCLGHFFPFPGVSQLALFLNSPANYHGSAGLF